MLSAGIDDEQVAASDAALSAHEMFRCVEWNARMVGTERVLGVVETGRVA